MARLGIYCPHWDFWPALGFIARSGLKIPLCTRVKVSAVGIIARTGLIFMKFY
jgi:hypothetical protein